MNCKLITVFALPLLLLSNIGIAQKLTSDIPKIIMTAEFRQALYGGKMFTFGHRQKFGNDPATKEFYKFLDARVGRR